MGQSSSWSLAPTGTLRMVFLRTNPVHGRVDPRTGEVTGPVADVARELASRHSVPTRIIPAENAAAVIATLKAGDADIGVLAYDETRAREVDFGAPIMVMLNSYLVKASSSIKSSADVDKTGITVAAVKGQAQELFVSRHLKQARIRLFETTPPDAEMTRLLVSGEVDAFAINRQRALEAEASSASMARALPDSLFEVNQCIVVAKRRPRDARRGGTLGRRAPSVRFSSACRRARRARWCQSGDRLGVQLTVFPISESRTAGHSPRRLAAPDRSNRELRSRRR
jgi:polar amino acid transport system substrate-binding protein